MTLFSLIKKSVYYIQCHNKTCVLSNTCLSFYPDDDTTLMSDLFAICFSMVYIVTIKIGFLVFHCVVFLRLGINNKNTA